MRGMNKLPVAKRATILEMLCEGSSLRAVTRITDVPLNTVTRLLIDAGKACWLYHNEHVRDVKAIRIQCDALEASSKLLVSYMVGGRDGNTPWHLWTTFAPASRPAYS
jgi:hypothetical protein